MNETRYYHFHGDHAWCTHDLPSAHRPLDTSLEADQPGWTYAGTSPELQPTDFYWDCSREEWEFVSEVM